MKKLLFMAALLFCYRCSDAQVPSLPKDFPALTLHCQMEMYKLAKPIIPLLNSPKIKLDDLGSILSSDLGKMIDSWGKPPPRLLNYNTNWMGAYDECRTLNRTKFCVSNMKIFGQLPGTYGSCMPKDCTDADVFKMLKYISENCLRSAITFPQYGGVNWRANGSPVLCEEEVKYSTGFYITVVLFGIVLALCLLGSFLDGFIEPLMIPKPRRSANRVEHAMEMDQKCDIQMKPFAAENADDMKASACTAEDEKKTLEGLDKEGNIQKVKLEDVNLHDASTANSESETDEIVEMVNGEAVFLQVLRCFSLQRNTIAIFGTEMPNGSIKSINGMRTISMWWIILGHVVSHSIDIPNDNVKITIVEVLQRWSGMPLANPFVSVDSFFFLSGLLVGYLTLRKMEKTNGRLNIGLFYLHRFVRLTPTYIFVILFTNNIFQYTINGPPFWSLKNNDNCEKYWWTNLLYINNFYPEKMAQTCVGVSWYLANDMQFYIVSPVILFVMYRLDKMFANSKMRTLAVSSVIIVLCAICSVINAIMVGVNDYPVLILKGNMPGNPRRANIEVHDDIYEKPYTRINPYLIGLLLGYIFMRKIQIKTQRFTTLVHLALWIIAFGLGYAIVYGTYSEAYAELAYYLSDGSNIMYGAFHRLIWAVALAYVVYACHNGYGGVIDSFLSWGAWVPLSRLTYCTYFVHTMVIDFYYATMDNPYHYQDDILAFDLISITFVSYAMAFILAVTVEYPFIHLEKILFKMLGVSK